jgi:hypothetical protein
LRNDGSGVRPGKISNVAFAGRGPIDRRGKLIDFMKLVIPGRREAANPESSNLRR